jgi:hypothetical protein
MDMLKVFAPRRGGDIDYEAAFRHQLQRNEMLIRRNMNLVKELDQQKKAYEGVISALDPFKYDYTIRDWQDIKTHLYRMFSKLRFFLGTEGWRYGFSELAQGYNKDGQMDLGDDYNRKLQSIAQDIDFLLHIFDIDDK